ncbi:LysR family transcriptional regulator [Sediminicoccus sp. KRV36]|uniref:LysR family transcriptional regulator n=1 Tax=Sediminicoccus sp. KRV36 TaxID=3133721 RepID=UPI00200FC38A|nr:LysR family transcriptional regulator [Sediminicoccus rosea]UPY36474.1 LysR family transcriptional regulator [Sediminicoccus rosea]
MDRFAAISAFIAVVDRQGFAPAARHLGLVPSAVTRHVAALEAHLGVRLLARTTRSVTLTEAGAGYLERARRIMAELAEAEEFAQSERLTPVGRLVVSAPAVFGRLHVAPLMAEFLNRHAGVQGQLQLSDRWINLVEEGMDCAIRIGHLPDSGLVARRLGETRRVVVAAPGYLARHGTPRDPGEVSAHRIIRFSAFEGAEEWRLFRAGMEQRVPIAPRLVTNSADAALCAAEREGGLTMVLAYQAREAVAAGRLVRILRDFEPPPMPIQIAWPAARLIPAKLRAFIETAVECCDWRFA